MLNAPVEEQIGGRNVYNKQYTEVEYVPVKTKYFIISYDSGFCLVDVRASAVYFANTPSQLIQEGKLGKPKEEIGNLNGFEYMYLSNLKVPYFLYSSSVSIKVISMGMTGIACPCGATTKRAGWHICDCIPVSFDMHWGEGACVLDFDPKH